MKIAVLPILTNCYDGLKLLGNDCSECYWDGKRLAHCLRKAD